MIFNDEMVTNVKANVDEKIAEINTLIGKIEAENGQLASIWKGEDIQKYTSAVEAQMQAFKTFEGTLTSVSESLGNAVRIMQTTREENSSQIVG